MENKRGQGFSIGTLLALIIGAALLVFLVFALSGGFGDWNAWTGGFNKPNIAAISFNCNNKCAAKDTTYCTASEDVVFEKGGKKEKYNCKALEAIPNSGVSACEMDCAVEAISCERLKVYCSGQIEGKCNYAWIDLATLKTYQADTGVGKTYKEVTDSTSRVTDNADKTANPGKFCVKTVMN